MKIAEILLSSKLLQIPSIYTPYKIEYLTPNKYEKITLKNAGKKNQLKCLEKSTIFAYFELGPGNI